MSSIGVSLNANLGLGFPASINVPGGFGGVAGVGLATASGPGQTFMTRSLPNSRTAYYTLAIIRPSPSTTPLMTYIFPLSPNSIIKEPTSLTNIYDVAGPANTQGVTRVVDSYGMTPPMFLLQGTTGWQYHSTDGYAYTGIDSILLLESMFTQFAQLNQQQANNGNPSLYTMEFYDHFKGDFWQVVPMGPQRITITSERPLLFEYSLRLAGLQNLATSPTASGTSDPSSLESLSSYGSASLANTVSQNITSTLSDYSDMTLGAGL
jgi:hypothetical protein